MKRVANQGGVSGRQNANGDPFDVQHSDGYEDMFEVPKYKAHEPYQGSDQGPGGGGPDSVQWADVGEMIEPGRNSTGITGSAKTAAPLVTDEDSPPQDSYEFQGLPIIVENPAGSFRKWKDKDGKESGKTKMHWDYGFIDGYNGADGEEVDVYIGPEKDAQFAFIIHQMKKPLFDEYDEDKVMLGFNGESEAKEAYLKQYNDPGFYGGMSSMPMDQFKEKLEQTKESGSKITHAKRESHMLKSAAIPFPSGQGDDIKPKTFARRYGKPPLAEFPAGEYFDTVSYEMYSLDPVGDPQGYMNAIDANEGGSAQLWSREAWEEQFPGKPFGPASETPKEGSLKNAESNDVALDEGTDETKASPATKALSDEKLPHVEAMTKTAKKCPQCGSIDVERVAGAGSWEETWTCDKGHEFEVTFDHANDSGTYASVKTAEDEVGHEQDAFKEGDKVIQLSTRRPGKVTTCGGHVCTVEFTDDKQPQIRNVWSADLEKASEKKASRNKPKLAEVFTSLLKEEKQGRLISAGTEAVLEKHFDDYCYNIRDNVYAFLKRERAGDMREIEKNASARGMFLQDEHFPTLMRNASIRESVKDGFWNEFITVIASERNDTHGIPETVIRRVLIDLDDGAQKGSLSQDDEATQGLLEHEEERRQRSEYEEYNQKQSNLATSDEFCPHCGEVLGREADGTIVCSHCGYTDDLGNMFEDDDSSVGIDALTEMSHDMDERLAIRAPKEAARVDRDYHMSAEKTAAAELPFDIFGTDSASDYSMGERNLSTIAVERLTEERPRMLADRATLTRTAAKSFREAMKSLKASYTIESTSLQKIAADIVSEQDGSLITGELTWQVILSSHSARRRVAVTLLMPVVNGHPVPQVKVVTAAGKEIPFTKESLDNLMNVREDRRSGKVPSRVPVAWIKEQ